MNLQNVPEQNYRRGSTRRLGIVLRAFYLLISLSPMTSGQESDPRVPLKELEPCSILNQKIYRESNDIERPYMSKMRALGVERASIQVQAVYRKGKAEELHVTRRIYFEKLDGPDSQISDGDVLNAIKNDGLQATLDKVALENAMTAKILGRVDPHIAPVRRLSTDVQIFSTGSIHYESLLAPFDQLSPLFAAAQAAMRLKFA